jgi:hypothetical protein
MATLDDVTLANIKREIRENQSPYFEDGDFPYYYEKNGGDFNATCYEMLLVKAEDSTISVSGLTTQDTSAYFRRLASRFRPFNTGVLPSD